MDKCSEPRDIREGSVEASFFTLEPNQPSRLIQHAASNSDFDERRGLSACSSRQTLTDWGSYIAQIAAAGRTSTRELAGVIHAAKSQLAFGDWTTLWKSKEAPFSKRKADMFATIGRELEKLDEQNSARLPMPWNVLYEIALLGAANIVRLIAEGAIHPRLSLREAQQLRCRRSRPGNVIIERLIRRLEDALHQTGTEFSQVRRSECATALNRLAIQIVIVQR